MYFGCNIEYPIIFKALTHKIHKSPMCSTILLLLGVGVCNYLDKKLLSDGSFPCPNFGMAREMKLCWRAQDRPESLFAPDESILFYPSGIDQKEEGKEVALR